MGNKITLHIIRFNEHCLEFLRIAQPPFAKIVAPFGHDSMKLKRAKELSPNTEWICRLYRDEQPLDWPANDAGVHAGLMHPYWDFYDIFEGYNEPPPFGIEDWKRVNEFEYQFARIVHEKGKKNVAFNWSNGQPPYEAWWHCQDAAREADYIGIHSYGWPYLSTSEGFALRHRAIPRMNRPILITEFGFTNAVIGGPDVGYYMWDIHPWAAREYKCIEELAWFADRLQEDPYVLAACYFTTGRLPGDPWGTHDWTPKIYRTIAGYNPQTRPKEEEPKMKNPIKVGIRQDYRIWNSPVVRVETMEMEEYLRRCVPYEVYASWKPEALKAQAVAARTFATWMKEHGKHPECHVCNSACCQVMGPSTDPRTDKAVKDTEGILITYQGEPIKAEYFSFCGGETEDGGLPYQKPVMCSCFEIAPKDTVKAKHNRGMCQWGAHDMAAQGATYKEILWHYYTGCEVDGEKAPLEKPDPIQEALQDIALAKSKIEGMDYLRKQALESLDEAVEHLKERR